MRIRWRIIFLFLGLFLVGVIGLAAVPYLNHLIYPDSLPRSAVRRAIGYAVIPQDRQAVIPLDRQIDALGVPDHIRTEADARAYVEALVKRWWGNETNPSLAEFEERLTQAEYAAVRDPKKLIPESQVAKVFNGLMNEWQMPRWTRISVADLHAFRTVYAQAIYPRSIARLPDESIAPSCRPTEALFLLNTLDMRGSVPPEIRKIARDNSFPWSFLRLLKWSAWSSPPTETSVQNPVESDHKYTEYLTCRRKYFSNHQVTFENVVNHLFAELGIP